MSPPTTVISVPKAITKQVYAAYRSCCPRSRRRWRSCKSCTISTRPTTTGTLVVYSPAVRASDTDAGDPGAGQADRNVHVLKNDPQEGEYWRDGGAVRRLDGVAALQRPSAARARTRTCWGGGRGGRGGGGGRRAAWQGVGDGKDCERGEEGGELGEHGGAGGGMKEGKVGEVVWFRKTKSGW